MSADPHHYHLFPLQTKQTLWPETLRRGKKQQASFVSRGLHKLDIKAKGHCILPKKSFIFLPAIPPCSAGRSPYGGVAPQTV